MRPRIQDIRLYKGATDKVSFVLKSKTQAAINLTGVVFTVCLKDVAGNVKCTEDNVEVVPLDGKVTITFTPSFKEDLTGGKGSWSVKMRWSNGEVWRVIEGRALYVDEK